MKRRLRENRLSFIVPIIVFLLWVLIALTFTIIRENSNKAYIQKEADFMIHSIEQSMNDIIQKSIGLEYFILASLDTEFETELNNYVEGLVALNEGIENVSYAPLGIISYIYQDSLVSAIGRNLYLELSEEVREDVLNAEETGLITISGLLSDENHSCSGLAFRNPIYSENTFVGFINVCMSEEYLIGIFDQSQSDVFSYAIYNQYNISVMNDLAFNEENMYYYDKVSPEIYDWQLGLIVNETYMQTFNRTNIIFIVLTFVCFTAIGLGLAYYYYKSSEYLKQTEELIFFDYLTKLPNRHKLEEDMIHLIKKERPFFLLYGDLDNFKMLNDTYGHTIGDQILLELSRRFTKLGNDLIHFYRWGGDEFVCIIQSAQKDQVLKLVSKINQLLEHPIGINDFQYQIFMSLGISSYPNDASSMMQLIMFADIAMYKMKELTTNNYLFYNHEIGKDFYDEQELEEKLSKLDYNEIEVFLQPIVSLKTNEIIGFESLLRIQENGIYFNTQKVVNIAEKNGSITMIDLKVFAKSCEYLKRLQKINKNYIIEVNFSVLSLNEESIKKIKEILLKYDVESKYIVIEATETSKIFSYRDVVKILSELKELGFNIALDDFGSGYASLNHLAELPLTHLKVDIILIQNYMNQTNKQLLTAIKGLGQSLNFIIIAEGIETEVQLNYFKSIQYDYYQGYYFSKAKPIDEIIDLIKSETLKISANQQVKG
ncbi:MAG: bifunctional diguanylate cyclase/phosphodiesterase [Firmicutes bacterium]|nr:bifunctional diguanylate cyclase/phosphodiesterase [Bacillota bacterium]